MSTESSPSDGYWSEARSGIRAWMANYSESLAELYAGAVEMMYGPEIPGRVRFICHAVREIGNGLPNAVAGAQKRKRLDYASRLDTLNSAWTAQNFELSAQAQGPEHEDLLDSSTETVLPAPIAKDIDVLLRDHREARERPRASANRLFEACAPENRMLRDAYVPMVERWLSIINWFMRKAHDSGEPDRSTDAAEMIDQFDGFEATLCNLAMVRPFFGELDEIDAILDSTNSRTA